MKKRKSTQASSKPFEISYFTCNYNGEFFERDYRQIKVMKEGVCILNTKTTHLLQLRDRGLYIFYSSGNMFIEKGKYDSFYLISGYAKFKKLIDTICYRKFGRELLYRDILEIERAFYDAQCKTEMENTREDHINFLLWLYSLSNTYHYREWFDIDRYSKTYGSMKGEITKPNGKQNKR